MNFLLPVFCRRALKPSAFTLPVSFIAKRTFLRSKAVRHTRLFSASSLLKALDMETVDTSAPLEKLRGLMRENKWDVYSNDLLWALGMYET